MNDYSPTEERLNVQSHALGFVLSTLALVLLVAHSVMHGNAWHIVGFTIFGVSLMTLYAASTLYHRAVDLTQRKRLKIFDHAAIYVLIAGTYTPFTLVTLNGKTGWLIFGLAWAIALMGIVLKLFFTGRFKIISTLLYVAMGWMIVFFINPLMDNLPTEGLQWIFGGGAAYTIGAILYSIKKIPFNHVIFHVLVLIGSFCHFMAVYFYILP